MTLIGLKDLLSSKFLDLVIIKAVLVLNYVSHKIDKSMSEIQQLFFNFLMNPKSNKETKNIKTKKAEFKSIILLLFLSSIIVGLLSINLLRLIDPSIYEKLEINTSNNLTKNPLLYTILFTLLISPIFENLASFLWLDMKKRNLLISFFILTTILIIKGIQIQSGFYLALFPLVIFIIFYFLTQEQINKLASNYYGVLFYTNTFVFAVIHYFNFFKILPLSYFWLIPIKTLPQFTAGLFFGFTRLRLGFFWSIVLHVIINSPPFLIMLFKNIL